MVDWKSIHPPSTRPPPPPPPPPPLHSPTSPPEAHPSHQHHLPPPFRQQPAQHPPDSPASQHIGTQPSLKRARPPHHGSPDARHDQSSPPPHHSYKPRPPPESSPMRASQSYGDDLPLSHSPSVHGPSPPEAPQAHPLPQPEFHRRRSDMEAPHPAYGSGPHTLGEHMREQQHMHHPTPPVPHAYPPHHLDTSVAPAYGPQSQPHSAPPYHPQSYSYLYDTNGADRDAAQKRKAVRASQACDNCRAKKAKCDEQKPCGNCVTNNMVCHFRDVQPPKQERSMLQLTETVTHLVNGFQSLEGSMAEVQSMLFNVARRLDSGGPLSPNDRSSKDSYYASLGTMHDSIRSRQAEQYANSSVPNESEYQHGAYSEQGLKAESGEGPHSDMNWERSPHRPVYTQDQRSSDDVEDQDQLEVRRDLERRREEAQLDMLNGNVSLAPRHFTAANHLADWPSISPSFHGIARRDYVKRGEHYHSLHLRSILQRAPKLDQAPTSAPAASPAAHSEHDDASTVSNTSDGRPAMAFVKQGSEGSKGLHPTPGGRNPRDQSLSIDKETSYRLVDSYLKYVHIQIPFLRKDSVYQVLDQFISSYCSEPSQPFSPFAVVDSPLERPDSRGPVNNAKRRKYSHGPTENGPIKSTSAKIPIERSVENALLLLIFALGKACEHQGPLPSLIGEVKLIPAGTPVPAGVTCSSVPQSRSERNSPALMSMSYPQPSEVAKVRRAHDEHSVAADHRVSDPYSQDIDRVPGLAYYVHAVQILGEAHGENSLVNVQAQLLAGLYMSQLLRVNDSYKWICSACMTWQMLFKQRDEEVRNITEEERTTFWACLVLESDIVAECDCIQSGISKWEDQMRYPKMEDDLDPVELECKVYFLSQIAIRKILNRAHSALHTLEEDKQKNQEWQRLSSQDLAEQLEAWRSNLPASIQWTDRSPLASTINSARLRGKYWGARYVIFRNYLKDVLHPMKTPDQQKGYSNQDEADYKTQFDKQKEAIARAAQCIDAAKDSTVAFDGVPGMRKRLIVTNPFGTAQAQFSNILVLSAAFNASSLHGQVQQHEIIALIDRTYDFLSNLAHLSPTMNTNLKILERTKQRVLSEGGSLPNSAQNSFQS